MLTAALFGRGAKAAWSVVRVFLPYVLMVLAFFACIYGAYLWHDSRVQAAVQAATAAAERACADAAVRAERNAFRRLSEAESRAIEVQAKASAEYKARIDELLDNYRTLRSRHAETLRADPPHIDCRVPADRVRLLREAIRGTPP